MIKITKMDQFDDLPDIAEKDNKPKWVTEVHATSPQDQQISNGLEPLFGDAATVVSPQQAIVPNTGDKDGQVDVQHVENHNENADGNADH